ncbi:hypothetical protein [Haloarcula salinisoli]|uniref:Uncharacterized protein n=1 Tax=Haloarcula salinisoli TaxID=2487746 RepID=A0A8J7YG85_9EURY|nr:hypothetical protein [Halomicroarcula salinisoli]MBX0305360.1 hypothetical protein [Halomicroarcula salinisoli]
MVESILIPILSAVLGASAATYFASLREKQKRIRQKVALPLLDEIKSSANNDFPDLSGDPISKANEIEEATMDLLKESTREDIARYKKNLSNIAEAENRLSSREEIFLQVNQNDILKMEDGELQILSSIYSRFDSQEYTPEAYRYEYKSFRKWACENKEDFQDVEDEYAEKDYQTSSGNEEVHMHLSGKTFVDAWKEKGVSNWSSALSRLIFQGEILDYVDDIDEYQELRKETSQIASDIETDLRALNKKPYWEHRIMSKLRW